MTDNSMTCDIFADRLMAYLEDDTDAPTRTAIERHAVTCLECGAVLADLRKLRIDAANLPEMAPSRDLWAGISARIETPVVSIGRPAVAHQRPARARAWRAGLLAASLVGTTAIGYLAGQRRADTPVPQFAANTDSVAAPATGAPTLDGRVPAAIAPEQLLASAPTGTATPTTTNRAPAVAQPGAATTTPVTAVAFDAQRVVAALTADYDKEVRQLGQLLESRRNQLDPVTVAVIERNLQVIETAILDSKAAIARDPASRFLIESLNQSLQMKVELMRTAAMLPSRT